MAFSSLSSYQAIIWFFGSHYGFLLVLKYNIGFLEWVLHIYILYHLEHDVVHGFIRGITLPLCFALGHLVTAGYSFSGDIDYVRTIMRALLRLREIEEKGYVINTLLLVFYLGVRILSVEVSFTYM